MPGVAPAWPTPLNFCAAPMPPLARIATRAGYGTEFCFNKGLQTYLRHRARPLPRTPRPAAHGNPDRRRPAVLSHQRVSNRSLSPA